MAGPFLLSGDPVTLAIDEGPYTGAEVEVLTDVPLGIAAEIGRLMVAFGDAEAGSAEEETALRGAWELFATAVLSGWNLHDRWGRIPAGAEAFARLSPRLITSLLSLWADLMLPKAEDG